MRASLRAEWIDEDRHASLQLSDSVAREGAPERARPDTWAAVSALAQRQRAVVVLSFWYGLSQDVESQRRGAVPRRSRLVSRGPAGVADRSGEIPSPGEMSWLLP
jgi:hypothetical protein